MKGYLDVAQKPVVITEGTIGLPILYYNTSLIVANFLVDVDRAQDLLPEGLQALRFPLARKKAIASVVFFHYDDSSVGPYNEMALAIMCCPDKGKKAPKMPLTDMTNPHAYVVDLPVTTATTNSAGREIWGYPKIVVPIGFSLRGESISCDVRDPHQTLLCRLEGKVSARNVAVKSPKLTTYTCLKDQILETEIDFNGIVKTSRAGSVKLICGDSQHHLVQHLKHLKLDGQKPFMINHAIGLQAILPEGTPI